MKSPSGNSAVHTLSRETPLISGVRVFLSSPTPESLLKREGLRAACCLGVVVLSRYMQSMQDKGLWVEYRCPFRRLFSIPCPTCGLTRSFAAVANCKIRQSVECHALGPLLFLLLLARTTQYLFSLLSGVRLRVRTTPEERRLFFLFALLCLVSTWLIRLSRDGSEACLAQGGGNLPSC